jgi:hypothetical protein
MISNPKGWRNRRAAALVRKSEKENLIFMRAQRWAAFEGLPQPTVKPAVLDAEKSIDEYEKEDKLTKVTQEIDSSTQALSDAVTTPNTEELSNEDLRSALEDKGLEVPKNTGRGRLVDLHKDHVDKGKKVK